MWVVRSILDRLILLAGVLVAGCVPGFIVQYRQRLSGRLDQVMQDLMPFQAIADREHHGSLAELVRYHLQSPDATFHQEGEALQSMLDAAGRLRAMVQGLDTDLAHQFAYLLTHADSTLLQATWGDYRPAIALDLQAIIFALVVGLALWGLFMLIWFAVASMLRSIAGVGPQRPARIEPRMR